MVKTIIEKSLYLPGTNHFYDDYNVEIYTDSLTDLH